MDLLVVFVLFLVFIGIALWLFRDGIVDWWHNRKGSHEQKGPHEP